MIKYKFIDGEGYMVKVSDDSLDKCGLCGCELKNDEVFYICEKTKKGYCEECQRAPPPCQRPRLSVIPTLQTAQDQCIHKKIIGKVKK